MPQTKGRGGGTLTPDLCNDLMEHTLKETVRDWEKKGYGVRCGEAGRLAHIIWADNVWVIVKKRDELIKMQDDIIPNGHEHRRPAR